jgi:predicted deacylase
VAKPGPTLCVTSGIHGDEINSVEIARRAFADVDANALAGTLVVLPAVNSFGFRTMNRYMPDRRDLNRFFPGSPNGSVATIVADVVFSGVIRQCTHLIDLHTGSSFRINLPQIRVDAASAEALELARHFGVGIIVKGAGPAGGLRRSHGHRHPGDHHEADRRTCSSIPRSKAAHAAYNTMVHLRSRVRAESACRQTRQIAGSGRAVRAGSICRS